MFRKIALIILLTYSLLNNCVHSGVTQYNVKLKGIEPFENMKNPWLNFQELKLKKLNKTHFAIDGIFNILRNDIAVDKLLVSVHGAIKMSNGYQQSSLLKLDKQSFCNFWENDQILMPAVKKAINVTDVTCPPKVGIYGFINYMTDTSKFPDNLPGKYWRFTHTYYEGDDVVGGYKCYMEIDSTTNVAFTKMT
ncbi:uncharacterized protein LOC123290932 [Chrysoperla carnea]|uniref:uncharacterized protein LOC123290932 n=1 Tax=Chrysoperla carnea TaxID=189513 RepID=UPI001D06DBD5|nr:uncharacterized protein LOC123290932 [Chrysoperla carnea]